ncbi:hypothetical protein [Pseudolabrys sp.]|uniref:hypothetical protein n=1 Tax=Pseudolabrys sp. TaxID=1960880 RepID=UPI003D1060C5
MPYESRSLNLFEGETYLPDYVRLRVKGCDDAGLALAAHHSGSTSAGGEGCDACVVPTLYDREAGEVMVDSLRICRFIDEQDGSDRLVPEALDDAIRMEIGIVDNLPNYQMLAAKPPGEDRRPPSQRGKNGIDFATAKVARCDKYLEQFRDDPDLVRAYRAKRDKEFNAKQTLFDPASMTRAYGIMEAALGAFDGGLPRPRNPGCSARRRRWPICSGSLISRASIISAPGISGQTAGCPPSRRFIGADSSCRRSGARFSSGPAPCSARRRPISAPA